MFAVKDLVALGGIAGKFDRRLDGLGAGVAEKHLCQPVRAALEKLLGKQPAEQRDVHLHHVGQLAGQHILQGLNHRRMVTPQGIDAEATEQIQILVALIIVEIRALGASIDPVITNGLEHAYHLRIEMLLVQGEILAGVFLQQIGDITGHSGSESYEAKRLINRRILPDQRA